MKRRVQKNNFSLIELLTVCGILLILAGIGVGVYSLVHRKMQDSRCHAMIAKMCVALENYKNKTGYYIQSPTISYFYVDKYTYKDADSNGIPDNPDPDTEDNVSVTNKRVSWSYTINNEISIPSNELDPLTTSSNPSGVLKWSRGAWKDPWGNKFYYQCPGAHNRMSFDLYSIGSDKLSTGLDGDPSKADDITNWKQ